MGFHGLLAQARCLDDLLKNFNLPDPLVIHLDVEPRQLIDRLTARRQCPECGTIYNLHSLPSRDGLRCEKDGADLIQRDDDKEEVIRRRFAEFELSSRPLSTHYSRREIPSNPRRGPARQDCRRTAADYRP